MPPAEAPGLLRAAADALLRRRGRSGSMAIAASLILAPTCPAQFPTCKNVPLGKKKKTKHIDRCRGEAQGATALWEGSKGLGFVT